MKLQDCLRYARDLRAGLWLDPTRDDERFQVWLEMRAAEYWDHGTEIGNAQWCGWTRDWLHVYGSPEKPRTKKDFSELGLWADME